MNIVIMETIGNIIGYVTKVGFVIVTVTVTAAGLFAYATKPSNNSFKTYIKEHIKSEIRDQDDGPIEKACKNLASNVGSKIIVKDSDIKDYVFIKVAQIKNYDKDNDNDMYFVGVCQNWFQTK